jgi:hypothetical protein
MMTTKTYWLIGAAVALVLIVGAGFVGADPELGDSVDVPPNEPTTLTAYPLSSGVTWDAPTLQGATTDSDGRLHFVSGAAGRKDTVTAHALHWFTGVALQHTTMVNVVGGPGPRPPTNDLVGKLREAYRKDQAKEFIRHRQKLELIGIYEAACGYCRDPSLPTVERLLTDIHDTADRLIQATALVELRGILRDVLAHELGDDPAAALDMATRDKAEKAFKRVIAALKEVG